MIVAEEKLYPNAYSLLTNLGGAISVWLGLSFAAILQYGEEVLEIVVKAIRIRGLQRTGENRSKK